MPDDQPDPRLTVLGHTIRQLRIGAGESQRAAAQACGIRSRAYWTTIEHGQVNVSLGKLLAIADHYGVSVSQLCAELAVRSDDGQEN